MVLAAWCAAASAGAALASSATDESATTGIAFDSVTKQVTSDEPPLRTEDFDTDVKAGPGPGQDCARDIIRRYLTTQRARIDDVCLQTGMIVDCPTRTVTWLDFRTMTYAVLSLDTKYSDFLAGMDAQALAAGMHSTISVDRSTFGGQRVADRPIDEYRIVMRQSTVSSALSITTTDTSTYYFLPTPLPELACADVAAPWLSRFAAPQRYAPESIAFFDTLLERRRGFTSETITEDGPTLPPWRVPLFSVGEHFQQQNGVPDFTYFFEVESGNIRPVRSDDPIFDVPVGFTKEP